MHKIAIIGRPNVGKSTLFNQLSLNTKAIVHETMGVTRDRNYGLAQLLDINFVIIDTPGFDESNDSLVQQMFNQALLAAKEADLILFLVDGKSGIIPVDEVFAKIIRSCNVVLVVNKCEKRIILDQLYYKLGFKDVVQISACHKLGFSELYEIMKSKLEFTKIENSNKKERPFYMEEFVEKTKLSTGVYTDVHEEQKQVLTPKLPIEIGLKSSIKVTIVGRPNTGKSTLINSLLKEQRVITNSESGTTRDAIEISWEYKNYIIKLIDTAGLRKRANVQEELEVMSNKSSITAINFSNVVILLLDATRGLERQDLKIANLILDEGRAIVIGVNKWDLVKDKDKEKYKQNLKFLLKSSLSQAKNIEVIYMSALKETNVNNIIDEAIAVYKDWQSKISTSKLNKWLGELSEYHVLKTHGRAIKLKYITQVNIRPPTFKIFCNNPEAITKSYKQYLFNHFREKFRIKAGVPLRLMFMQ